MPSEFFIGFSIVIGGMAGSFAIPLLIALVLILSPILPIKTIVMQTLVYQPKLSSLGGISLKG